MNRALAVSFSIFVLANGAIAQAPDTPVAASTLNDLFAEANVAASRGSLDEARDRYLDLIRAGVHDPDVCFNLATTLAQAGDYPGAILNFERALALRPGDAKAEDNLRAAEKALEEARAEVEGEASIQRNRSLGDATYRRFTENGLAYALLLSNLLLFAVLGWAWLRRRRGRTFYSLLASAGIVMVFSALGLAVKSDVFRDGPLVIVLADRVKLREGPDPRARIRGEARGADRAVLVDEDGDFVKLRVIGGPEGWVDDKAVGSVTPTLGAH